jgi:hypothetical protein
MRPHWSADGRSVLAVRIGTRDAAAVQEAVRIDVASGRVEALRALGTQVSDVQETRDGRWLLWGEPAGHAMRLLRAPLGEPARAERLPLPLVAQHQLDGDAVVFVQPQVVGLTRCELASLVCEPIAIEIGESELYHWALGPGAIYFRSRAGGAPHLARYDLATRRVQHIADLIPNGAGTSIAVSRDGRRLVIAREEPPAIDLMLAR